MMKGLFCPVCKARNNEEYRAILKKRQMRMYWFIIGGIVTEGISLFAYFCPWIQLSDYRLGFLLGAGAGMAFGGMVGLIRIRGKLKDEEKLKEFRLKETDERELELDSLALQGAARILLAALYVLMIFGGVLNNDGLLNVSIGLLAIFLIGNMALRKYYESKI